MRARSLRDIALAAVATLFTAPLTAQETLEVIGSRSYQIPPVPAERKAVDVSIPVRWSGPAQARVLLQVLEVNLGGEPRDASTVQFLLRPHPTTRRPTLLARVDLVKAATAGTYAVKVQPPQPSTTTQPPAPLELSFVRPAAEVRVDTPLRLERVLYLPGIATLRPRSLTVTETTSRSPVLLANRTWVAELRGTDGKPAQGRLRFTFPPAIEAWAQGRAAVEVLSAPALGRSSGTLTLRSEQLAARSVDFPLEIASRVSLLWLLVTLAGSIALGYLTRTRIDERRKRFQASLQVERQRRLLNRLLEESVDESLKARLEQILGNLDTQEETAPNVDAIVAAGDKARTETETELAQATQKRATLRAQIDAWTLALGPAEAQARQMAEAIGRLLLKLKAQEKALADGHVGRVEAFLKTEQQEVRGIREAVEAWLNRLEAALDRGGSWPVESRYAATATEIGRAVGELRTGLNGADTVQKLGPILSAGAALAGRVRSLLSTGVDSVLSLAETVREGLAGLADPALKEHLAALASLESQLDAARNRSSEDEPQEAGAALHELGEAIAAALMAAYCPTRKKDTEPAEPAGLTEKRYTEALRDVLNRRQSLMEDGEERSLGVPTADREAGPARKPPGSPEPSGAARRPVWTAALDLPAQVFAGREAMFYLRLRVPAGQTAPVVTVRWFLGGAVAHQGVPGDLGWSFTPRQPGPVRIRAEAMADDGETVAADARLLVLPADGHDTISVLTERLRRDERTQSIVSGVLIAAAGFAMFSGAFVGTFQDFLAAAFWGYTVDLGVSRVRDMAGPLLTRQPFPPAP